MTVRAVTKTQHAWSSGQHTIALDEHYTRRESTASAYKKQANNGSDLCPASAVRTARVCPVVHTHSTHAPLAQHINNQQHVLRGSHSSALKRESTIPTVLNDCTIASERKWKQREAMELALCVIAHTQAQHNSEGNAVLRHVGGAHVTMTGHQNIPSRWCGWCLGERNASARCMSPHRAHALLA